MSAAVNIPGALQQADDSALAASSFTPAPASTLQNGSGSSSTAADYVISNGEQQTQAQQQPVTSTNLPVALSSSAESTNMHYRPQVDARVLYGGTAPRRPKTRTYSDTGGSGIISRQRTLHGASEHAIPRVRRLSHDEQPARSRRFLVDVEETMRLVLEQEDSDGNFQIHAADSGPKVFALGTEGSGGYRSFEIRGTYMLSNLLQELALARDHGQKQIVLDEARLAENPVDRLSRMIRHSFWSNLTRRIDADGLEAICVDSKNRGKNQQPRIYVPERETRMLEYYRRCAAERPAMGLLVETLPADFDRHYVKSLNDKPGILAIAMRDVTKADGTHDLEGIPFVVPGARFNELYNWDSYFVSLGLITDGHYELAKGIVDHFLFEIKHYKKILNGNRSYYLMRSQPPFLTDLILQVYNELDPANEADNHEWLRRGICGAIREYFTVWMAAPRFDDITGLSRYRPDGLGIPPETEASHFISVLQPFADKEGVSVNEYIDLYDSGQVSEPKLDEYFMHDRAVRESGHDTTYRFEKRCANLATVDLNALLYKYEDDIAAVLERHFDGSIEIPADDDDADVYEFSAFPFGTELPVEQGKYDISPEWSQPRKSRGERITAAEFRARAQRRKQLADHYLWHSGHGIYYDWDTARGKQLVYDSVTTFWPMWCQMASQDQAEQIMRKSLKKFEVQGGLVSGTEASRGKISLDRPNRQWDYPAAWPPHQIMAWVGMQRYGYIEEAERVAYRWLYMVTSGFVEAGGVVPEKFDAVACTSNIDAEYGNQGTDFKHVPREGFGWTNASYQIALSVISPYQRRALGTLTPPDLVFKRPAAPSSVASSYSGSFSSNALP